MSGSRGLGGVLGTVAERETSLLERAGNDGQPKRRHMSSRRLVGNDLGIASAHTMRVLEGESTMSVVPIVKNAAA